MIVLVFYIALFVGALLIVSLVRQSMTARSDFTSLKTVTFGDESAVRPDRAASIISVVSIFILWAAFTGSSLFPLHVPGPFSGETEFTYTVQNAAGETDDATVSVVVYPLEAEEDAPEVEPGDGFAKNDSDAVAEWRSTLIRAVRNDDGEDLTVTAVDGQSIAPGETVRVADGTVTMTPRGSLNFAPSKGMQMEPIWLPPPEAVVGRFFEIASEGYQNFTLWQHLGWSLLRVLAGFALGAMVGIPLGYAMGLSGWFRGWFDPIVEFMRPVPPLALIPLVIIWFGIWETGKIILLFLAALWIMTIAGRAGVSGVKIS